MSTKIFIWLTISAIVSPPAQGEGSFYFGGIFRFALEAGSGRRPPARRAGKRAKPACPPLQAAGGLRPALPLFYSLLCHTAVEPQGRGQPVAVTGSPISEEKVVPFPAKRRLTVVFRIYSITLGLKPVV